MADSYCESGRVPVSVVAPPCVPVCLVGAALRVLAYQLVLFRGGVAAATTPSAATARLTATTTRSSSVHPGRSISITTGDFGCRLTLGMTGRAPWLGLSPQFWTVGEQPAWCT